MKQSDIDNLCFVCSASTVHFGSSQGYEYVRCQSCETIQLAPLPSKTSLASLYEREYADSGHHDSSAAESKRIKLALYNDIRNVLLKYSSTGRVLDVGAGWGGLCEVLQSSDIQCVGVEQSQEMVAYCQENDLPVSQGDLDTVPDESFDAIVMCTVFEHLTEHDEFLKILYRKLKKDGFFVSVQPTSHFAAFFGSKLKSSGELPDLNGAFAAPWHTALLSCSGMKSLVERNGFSTVLIDMASNTRRTGPVGLLLRIVELVNRFLWPVVGVRWPLVISHLFVFQKQ